MGAGEVAASQAGAEQGSQGGGPGSAPRLALALALRGPCLLQMGCSQGGYFCCAHFRQVRPSFPQPSSFLLSELETREGKGGPSLQGWGIQVPKARSVFSAMSQYWGPSVFFIYFKNI